MSGLAAVFQRDGSPVRKERVWSMIEAVPYRGPDGLAAQTFGQAGLGGAMMVTTPEDRFSTQPLASPRTGCVIVADVRLDNRSSLSHALAYTPPPDTSDSELILLGYESWGDKVVAELLGDFAFVIWDPRRHRLVCARDTNGQRALFYRVDGRAFHVASEIHQLLQDPSVTVEPNEERIRDFIVALQLGRNEKEHSATFFNGIHSLPSGHVLSIDSTQVRLQRYWSLDPSEIRYRRDADYEDHFRALLESAVGDRLRSAGGVGALLSGGLDSASVVCIAQELLIRGDIPQVPFSTYSAVYDDLDCDERPLIADVQARCGFDASYLEVGAQRSARLQLEPAGFLEAPSMWGGAERELLLGAAVASGTRVLLTGEVADNCVSGSRQVFDSLIRQRSLGRLVRHLRAYRRVTGEFPLHTLARDGLLPLLPIAWQTSIQTHQMRRLFERDRQRMLPSWMPESLRSELSEHVLRICLDEVADRRYRSPAREAEYRLLYPPEVTRQFAPWPVEFRRPFADRRLHEFLLAIPPDQKFEPHPDSDAFYAGSKWLVRRALRGILPESVRTRTGKTVFNDAFSRELSRNWPGYVAAFGPGTRPHIAERGYIRREPFFQRLETLRQGAHGPDVVHVVRLVELETWLRAAALPRPRGVQVSQPRSVLTPATREDNVRADGR